MVLYIIVIVFSPMTECRERILQFNNQTFSDVLKKIKFIKHFFALSYSESSDFQLVCLKSVVTKNKMFRQKY